MIYVVGGVLVRNGLILLQQRSPHRDFPLLWECPGGKVEPGETPREALARELEEEIGLIGADVVPGALYETVFTREDFARLGTRAVVDDDFTVSFYQVNAPADWQPKMLDAVGIGWFDLRAHQVLPLIPGNWRFHPELIENWDLLNGRVRREVT